MHISQTLAEFCNFCAEETMKRRLSSVENQQRPDFVGRLRGTFGHEPSMYYTICMLRKKFATGLVEPSFFAAVPFRFLAT